MYMDEEVSRDRLLKESPGGRVLIDFLGPNTLLQPRLKDASSRFSKEKDRDEIPPQNLNVQKALILAIAFMNYIAIPYFSAVDDGTFLDLWTSERHATIFGVDLLIDSLCLEVLRFQSPSRQFVRYGRCRFSLAAEVRAVGSYPMTWRLTAITKLIYDNHKVP
jgi:hypothetical protein